MVRLVCCWAKGHGRLETRRCWQSEKISWFEDCPLWEGLRSVAVIESVREIDGQTSVERRYYLSSLKLDAARFNQAVRSHWGVENQLHWVLDVVFGENQNRARTRHAAQNLATLRRWTLNLIKVDQRFPKRSIKGRRKLAAWDESYLLYLLNCQPSF